jgi:integrase
MIEESDEPVLPVQMYAKLLAGLDGIRDRSIFLIACFCALRPSELFGLTWGCYTGNLFTIVNTAWRGRLQRKKNQAQEPLRTHQLSPHRDPPRCAQGG